MSRRRDLRAGLVCLGLAALAGCQTDPTLALRKGLLEARDQLRASQEQNLALRQQLHRQEQQVRTLQALGGDKRMDRLFTVRSVRIGGYSCGVNLDDRPGDDGVKVFVEPLDRHGSTVKAAGDVTIQLYDLAAPPGTNLLSTHRWPVEQIHDKWTTGFMSQYYIFEFPFASGPPAHPEITVRVEFTDYLTGLTFTDQKVCKVSLAPVGPASGKPPASQPASAPRTSPAAGTTTTPAAGLRLGGAGA